MWTLMEMTIPRRSRGGVVVHRFHDHECIITIIARVGGALGSGLQATGVYVSPLAAS